MSKNGKAGDNYESQSLIAKTHDRSQSLPAIFILCDTCHWGATYFDKNRLPREDRCPQCNANNYELTSFPIMSNESFTFDYNDKHGVEFEFKPRRKGD
jgi:hypothetical protein